MKLTLLLRDGYTALDIVGGYEVLANLPGIEVVCAARQPGLVWADTRRLALHAWCRFDDIDQTDILYVPGGPGVQAGLDDPHLIETIRRLDADSRWTVGICNGVEWLGRAGLLAGRRVTTNWFARDRVAAYGAQVSTARFERDGKLVTGAGVLASIDAALFLAGEMAGQAMVQTLQLGLEYYPQPPAGTAGPDEAPSAAQELVRSFEQQGPARVARLHPPAH